MSDDRRRLRDRLAEWDDRSQRNPQENFLWRHDFLGFVLAEIVVGVLYAIALWLLGPIVGVVALVGLLIGLLVAYLVWRRRRNRRLTGSPTRWP